MTVEVNDAIIGIWLVISKDGPWVLTLERAEDGKVFLKDYMKGRLRERKEVRNVDLPEILKGVRKAVRKIMEETESDKGWEAIRGARTMEEYMEVLRRLPAFKEKVSEGSKN